MDKTRSEFPDTGKQEDSEMTEFEFRKESFNRIIREQWETGKRMFDRYKEETDPVVKERLYRKSDEAFGFANGMSNAALILGYTMGNTEDDIPCLCEKIEF